MAVSAQAMLDKCGTVRIPDGRYLITKPLIIHSNTHLILSSMATLWFVDLFVLNLRNSSAESIGSAVATATITVLVLIFGEITPKSIAKDHPEGFAMAVSGLLRFISIVLTPINFIFMLWRKLVKKVFKPDVDEGVTEGEVLTLVDEAHEGGSIDEYNKEIIENIFEFDDITAGEIATHRTDLTMLAIDGTHEEWADIINNSRFSRYPVYGESVDDILGILDARTYFRLEDKSRESVMKTAMQDAYFVPETVKADVLFKNMKANKQYFSVVLDEYGGVLGVVTITDLIECLVGEFAETDEDEESEELISAISENVWQINGTASMADVEDAIGINLSDEDSDTFGGYVLGLYGSVPVDGTTFELSTEILDISIEVINEHKIEKAIVTLRAVNTPEESEEEKE